MTAIYQKINSNIIFLSDFKDMRIREKCMCARIFTDTNNHIAHKRRIDNARKCILRPFQQTSTAPKMNVCHSTSTFSFHLIAFLLQ